MPPKKKSSNSSKENKKRSSISNRDPSGSLRDKKSEISISRDKKSETLVSRDKKVNAEHLQNKNIKGKGQIEFAKKLAIFLAKNKPKSPPKAILSSKIGVPFYSSY